MKPMILSDTENLFHTCMCIIFYIQQFISAIYFIHECVYLLHLIIHLSNLFHTCMCFICCIQQFISKIQQGHQQQINHLIKIQKIYNSRAIMKGRPQTVFLLIVFISLFIVTHTKDLLLHTIQYRLSPEKLLSMATVKFNNDQQPAFMILEPEVEVQNQKGLKQTPIVSQEQLEQLKKQHQATVKTMAKAQFHTKILRPIRVLIHNQDDIEQQCLFDQPWDLCMISNPQKKKSLDFSIHCLFEDTPQDTKSGLCNGKITIRQSNLTPIVVSDNSYQQKVKYQSGLFELPQSERHSVMLVSCQDDDLPMFTDQLKIFSNARYHRYDRENKEEIKELVGFDRTLNAGKESTNPQARSTQPNLQPKTQTKDRKFIYLEVRQQMVRKCLQFEFYDSSDLINERKVFDYVNLTDSSYKNVYKVVRKQQLNSKDGKNDNKEDKQQTNNNNKKPSTTQLQQPQPLFKYNPQLTLNIFKPSHQIATSYEIKLKLINPHNHTTIVQYTFPFNNQSTKQLSTGLYAKSNHYHFCYVVGREIVEELREVKVELGVEKKSGNENNENKKDELGTLGEQFFFMTLSVQDVQSVSVERLTTTYLSMKKGSHITFLLEQPYQIDQIQTQTNSHPTDLVQILPSPELQITLSEHSSDHDHKTECHFSQGCKFELDVVNDCLQCKIEYKTTFIKSPNDVLMLEIKETIFEGKIDMDEIQYFYKELKEMEVVELIVNTPNIIIYTIENKEDHQKCKIPKKSCHSQIATSHQRIVLSNPSKSQKQIIFLAIQGLDKTRFSLLLVTSDKLINLMNGIPFTYKLPEKNNQIELLFEVPGFDQSKQYEHNVTFNLILPLNSLEMDVVQVKEDGEKLQQVDRVKTMAGFVKLFGNSVKARKIKVMLSKTTHYLDHSVHFTLIASTSDHKFRLDTGITHYQSLDSAEQKTFIIQFEDQHTYQLNLHLYDTPQKQISLTVSVFNPNQASIPNKKTLNYKINSKQWVLVLDDELVDEWDLCPENDPECMVFVTVASMMAHEVEMAVTLMTQDSVMELKDGVWETFRVDELLVRTHFYFTPTHSSNPVKIFFKSTNPQIFISASLYDNSQTINPAQWPFPFTHGAEEDFQMNENYMFKSKHLIQVDNEDEEFKRCFPHCVVLLSVIESEEGKRQKKQAQFTQQQSFQHFIAPTLSILASNNHIQLPQKLRLTLQMKPQQQQLIYIDLKHAFKQKKETLTFFTNMIVGYAQVYGKVYLPSLQNIPDEGDYDWVFGPVKTQVGLVEVRDVFMQSLAWMVDVQSVEEILQKEQLYLALFIVAQQPTKLTLQYTTDYQQITQLPIDSSQTVSLSQNEQKLFQFYPVRDQKIRFIRNKGYPLFHQFKCEAEEGGFDGCLKGWLQRLKVRTEDDIRNIRKEREVEKQLLVESPKITQDKMMLEIAALSQQQQQQFSQYQILKKTQTQHVIQCQRCIVFIWIYAMEESQLTIQLQSLSTQTLVKENEMLSDYAQPNEYHRYYLSRVQKELTTVVVSVNEGSPVVTVRDNLNFEQTKKGSQTQDDGKKVLLFTVPPAKQLIDKSNSHSRAKSSSFNTIFSNLHITITPQDSKPLSYTLSYSSGTHQTFLKNGVISTQYLFEKENTTFYYKNQNKERKSFLTLTVDAPGDEIEEVLQGIEIKMFVLVTDAEKGIMSKDEIATEQPSTAGGKFRKHTTLTYQLPPVDDLQIDIYSQKTTKITIGLTGGQLIFLPMDYEYPIHLEPKQQVKFLIQNLDPGQDIQLVLRKCDQSNPLIFYTLEEKQFENDRFGNYDKFGANNVYRHVVRAEGKRGVYIKIKADSKQPSTLIIKSSYIFMTGQDNFVDLDPGNMGLVEYQFQSLSQIAVKFEGLQCAKQCAQLTEYYLVRGKSLDEVYREMVCAGEMVVKLFEKKQRKDDTKEGLSKNKKHEKTVEQSINSLSASSSIFPQNQAITIQKIPEQQFFQSNTFHLTIPHHPHFPILTVKAIYKPTGQQIYYKPIQIKTIQNSVQSYSSRLVMVFAGAVVIGIVALVVVTRNLARRGYVHVGQEETMVV